MIGLGAVEKVPHAFDCVTAVENAKNTTKEAIALITSGSITNVVKGIKEL